MNEDIKKEIDSYKKEIATLFDPTSFQLNSRVVELKSRILSLQKRCTHKNSQGNFELKNGYCPYCGKKIS